MVAQLKDDPSIGIHSSLIFSLDLGIYAAEFDAVTNSSIIDHQQEFQNEM